MAGQCVPLAVCGSVFTIRAADRFTEEGGGRMSDGEMKANPAPNKLFAPCPLLKVDGNSAQLIYPDTVVIFEV
jgi:hypothetical protein